MSCHTPAERGTLLPATTMRRTRIEPALGILTVNVAIYFPFGAQFGAIVSYVRSSSSTSRVPRLRHDGGRSPLSCGRGHGVHGPWRLEGVRGSGTGEHRTMRKVRGSLFSGAFLPKVLGRRGAKLGSNSGGVIIPLVKGGTTLGSNSCGVIFSLKKGTIHGRDSGG